MDRIFKKISIFCIVYIDDILVFSHNKYVYIAHIHKIFDLCKDNNIILSKKKIELFKNKIDFLGLKIDKGKIELQPHITTKILSFPNKLEETKELQKFLGLLNYGRKFIPNLSTLVRPLYNKLSKNGQRYFNNEDVKLIQRIKEIVKNLGPIALPIDSYYKIIQTDASSKGWAGILIQKPNKGSPKDLEEIAMYSSGKFSEPESRKSSTELELLGIINTLNNFHIYIQNESFTIRTDCNNIVEFYKKVQKKNFEKKNSFISKRWISFLETLTGRGYKAELEHISGKDNTIADILSRLINI